MRDGIVRNPTRLKRVETYVSQEVLDKLDKQRGILTRYVYLQNMVNENVGKAEREALAGRNQGNSASGNAEVSVTRSANDPPFIHPTQSSRTS